MFSFLNRTPRAAASFTPAAGHQLLANPAGDGVAHQLLERAEASAGRDPYRARELRDAARAYLSVVR